MSAPDVMCIRVSAQRDGPPVVLYFSVSPSTAVEAVKNLVLLELRALDEFEGGNISNDSTFLHLSHLPWKITLTAHHPYEQGRKIEMEDGRLLFDYGIGLNDNLNLWFSILATNATLNGNSHPRIPRARRSGECLHIACPGDMRTVASVYPPILLYVTPQQRSQMINIRFVPQIPCPFYPPTLYNWITDGTLKDWRSLRLAAPEVQDNYEIICSACRQRGNRALFYASPDLRGNRTFVLETARFSRHVLQYCDDKLWGDLLVVATALCNRLPSETKYVIIMTLQQSLTRVSTMAKLEQMHVRNILGWVGPKQVTRAGLADRLRWATSEQRMQIEALLASAGFVTE